MPEMEASASAHSSGKSGSMAPNCVFVCVEVCQSIIGWIGMEAVMDGGHQSDAGHQSIIGSDRSGPGLLASFVDTALGGQSNRPLILPSSFFFSSAPFPFLIAYPVREGGLLGGPLVDGLAGVEPVHPVIAIDEGAFVD